MPEKTPIGVFLDNNVWDFLYDRAIDLAVELSREEFSICITREAEFEIPPMPPEKLAFVRATIERCAIKTDTFFGFAEAGLASGDHRVAGFGQGRWSSKEELDFIQRHRTNLGNRMRPSRLYGGEADVSLAARAVHSVVLSFDAKPGPLRDAYEQGGYVIFLTDFEKSGLSLRDFIHLGLAKAELARKADTSSPSSSESAALKPTYEEIRPDAGDLLVFIDDTGHETFSGNQAFYGLGGCVIIGQAYERLKAEWRAVRAAINGNPDAPLHGSDITANPRPESFAALRAFFEDRSFARIAVTITSKAGLPSEMHPCVPVMGQLVKEIETIATLVPCRRIWIILESSNRADSVVRECFGQLAALEESRVLPIEHCLMPKSTNEPGLEVADFVISAAGSEVQRRMRGKQGHAPDFNDVFCRLPPVGCRYREIAQIEVHLNGLVSVDGVRLTDTN